MSQQEAILSVNPDLNKTPLTHQVTAATLAWLTEKGFKPIQTEVPIALGWVADIAAVIVPTNTELQALKLIRRMPKYNYSDHSAQTAWYNEAKELSGKSYTCLVEVKTSRADFKRDQKWALPMPTNLAYLAIPKGIITIEEWPERWGILEFNEGALRCLRPASLSPVATEKQASAILSIAVRLHNTVNYAKLNAERLNSQEREKAQRASDIINGVCQIVETNDTDFERAVLRTRLRMNKLTKWELDRLRKLLRLGKHLYEDQKRAV